MQMRTLFLLATAIFRMRKSCLSLATHEPLCRDHHVRAETKSRKSLLYLAIAEKQIEIKKCRGLSSGMFSQHDGYAPRTHIRPLAEPHHYWLTTFRTPTKHDLSIDTCFKLRRRRGAVLTTQVQLRIAKWYSGLSHSSAIRTRDRANYFNADQSYKRLRPICSQPLRNSSRPDRTAGDGISMTVSKNVPRFAWNEAAHSFSPMSPPLSSPPPKEKRTNTKSICQYRLEIRPADMCQRPDKE